MRPLGFHKREGSRSQVRERKRGHRKARGKRKRQGWGGWKQIAGCQAGETGGTEARAGIITDLPRSSYQQTLQGSEYRHLPGVFTGRVISRGSATREISNTSRSNATRPVRFWKPFDLTREISNTS